MANKRTHSSANITTQTPAPKKINAFAHMMNSRKASTIDYGDEAYNLELSNIKFETWLEALERNLNAQNQMLNPSRVDESKDEIRAERVAMYIIQATEGTVLSQLAVGANFKTKLDALHALIGIASAVAFAPLSPAHNLVRSTRVPSFLIDNMYKILKSMPDWEIKRVISTKTFVAAVHDLKYTTTVCWDDPSWKELDEVLRLLKDTGPLNFRKSCDEVFGILDSHSYNRPLKPEEIIIRIIRTEIASCVRKDSCFETKYNALNALSDIGISLLGDGSSRCSYSLVWGPLSSAMLKVGKLLTEADRDQVTTETIKLPGMASPTFLDDFLATQGNDYAAQQSATILLLRSLIKMRAFREQDCFLRIYYELSHNSRCDEVLQTLNEPQDHCTGQNRRLILKLLYLRWSRRDWDPSLLIFDEILDLFINTSLPLSCSRFESKVENALKMRHYSRSDAIQARKDVYEAVSRVSRRIDYRACFVTKSNAFKALAKMGLSIARSLKISMTQGGYPGLHDTDLRDPATETLLVSSMIRICQSLGNKDLSRMISDQELVDDIVDLGHQRLPDMLKGLDAVLSLVNNQRLPELSNASRIADEKHVVDLTLGGIEVLDLTITSDGIEVVDLT